MFPFVDAVRTLSPAESRTRDAMTIASLIESVNNLMTQMQLAAVTPNPLDPSQSLLQAMGPLWMAQIESLMQAIGGTAMAIRLEPTRLQLSAMEGDSK